MRIVSCSEYNNIRSTKFPIIVLGDERIVNWNRLSKNDNSDYHGIVSTDGNSCRRTYVATSSTVQLDNILRNMDVLGVASRGFIETNRLSIKPGVGHITFSTCDGRHMFSGERLTVSRSYSPVSMSIRQLSNFNILNILTWIQLIQVVFILLGWCSYFKGGQILK